MNVIFKNNFLIGCLLLITLFFSCEPNEADKSFQKTTLFSVKIGDNGGFVDSSCNFHQELVYQMADEFMKKM